MYALEAKALLPALSGKFYGVLAQAIYVVKCYPTPGEYQRIGQQIIKKYPFLKLPLGEPYVSDQHHFVRINTGTCAIHTLGTR